MSVVPTRGARLLDLHLREDPVRWAVSVLGVDVGSSSRRADIARTTRLRGFPVPGLEVPCDWSLCGAAHVLAHPAPLKHRHHLPQTLPAGSRRTRHAGDGTDRPHEVRPVATAARGWRLDREVAPLGSDGQVGHAPVAVS